MNFFSRIASLLTRGGREDDRLLQAIEHAKAKRPEQAIAIYTELLESDTIKPELRARALFNRALAHSSLKHDHQAQKDLEQVLLQRGLPENVQQAARAQLARVKKRSDERSE